MTGQPLVSIIIPVFNLWEYTLRCLISVKRHAAGIPHEVIVVDDASTDESTVALPLLEGIRLIRNERNEGYARNNNKAAAVARGKYLLLLNNDTEVFAGWLAEMLKVIEAQPDVGMVGSKLLFPDGTIQHAGVGFSYGAYTPISPFHILYQRPASESDKTYDVNAVTAACALIPKDLFVKLGGFDEGFRMGYEDVDLCLRVRTAGFRIVYAHLSVATHFESLSPGRFVATRRNTELLHHKWLGRLDAFESDYRKLARPVALDPGRPPCSVVVAVHDHLSTVAPCLENLWRTLGPNDELVVVDDGGVGATTKFLALFMQSRTDRGRLIRSETRQGLAAAWATGLSVCAKPFAAVVLPHLRVLEGWIDRMVSHLQANLRIGAVCASEANGVGLNPPLLLAAIPKADGGLALPEPQRAGDLEATDCVMSGVVVAERLQLADLVLSHPDGVPGGHPQLWSRALQAKGVSLASAADVTVYSLIQVFPNSGALARHKYFQTVATRLDGAVPTESLCSIVVVARNFPEALSACLANLCAKTPGPWELLVVDDGSAVSLSAQVQAAVAGSCATPPVSAKMIRNEFAKGFPAAINAGVAASTGRVVVVMNADVMVTPQWLVRMQSLLEVGAQIGVVVPVANVGPRPQCCPEPNFSQPPMPLDDFAAQRAPEYLGAFGGLLRIAGFCMAIKREVIDAIGGFDPKYEDTNGDVEDFALRVSRGGYLLALASDVYVECLGQLPQRWLELHPRRPPSLGWLRFCERWNHPVAESDTNGIERIYRAQSFNAATDFVPLVLPGS